MLFVLEVIELLFNDLFVLRGLIGEFIEEASNGVKFLIFYCNKKIARIQVKLNLMNVQYLFVKLCLEYGLCSLAFIICSGIEDSLNVGRMSISWSILETSQVFLNGKPLLEDKT